MKSSLVGELLVYAPGRTLWPLTHRFSSPGCRFIGVAARAGIGDFVFVGHRRSDEIESVRAHERAGDGDFDFGHVAGDALAAGGTGFVMRVRFERGGARAVA